MVFGEQKATSYQIFKYFSKCAQFTKVHGITECFIVTDLLTLAKVFIEVTYPAVVANTGTVN